MDHNVKGVAALVDRVLAMYLGDHVAEGTAGEVMRNETVRRVYLAARSQPPPGPGERARSARRSGGPQSQCPVRQGHALEDVSIHVGEGEFVSVVGLNGAGKTTLFNAISGLVPFSGTIKWRGETLFGRTPAGSPAAASCNVRKTGSCSATCRCGRTSTWVASIIR